MNFLNQESKNFRAPSARFFSIILWAPSFKAAPPSTLSWIRAWARWTLKVQWGNYETTPGIENIVIKPFGYYLWWNLSIYDRETKFELGSNRNKAGRVL